MRSSSFQTQPLLLATEGQKRQDHPFRLSFVPSSTDSPVLVLSRMSLVPRSSRETSPRLWVRLRTFYPSSVDTFLPSCETRLLIVHKTPTFLLVFTPTIQSSLPHPTTVPTHDVYFNPFIEVNKRQFNPIFDLNGVTHPILCVFLQKC